MKIIELKMKAGKGKAMVGESWGNLLIALLMAQFKGLRSSCSAQTYRFYRRMLEDSSW